MAEAFQVDFGVSEDGANSIRVTYKTAVAIIGYEDGTDGSVLLANLKEVIEQALQLEGE